MNANQKHKPTIVNSDRRLSWKTYFLMACVLGIGGFLAARTFSPKVDAAASDTIVVRKIEGQGNSNTGNGATKLDPSKGSLLAQISQEIVDHADHPFAPLLEIAKYSLDKIDREMQDYSANLLSQVRIDGVLLEEKLLFCKIRHPRTMGSDLAPFSIYTKFISPDDIKDQEAIWVDGWHEGNLVAHLTGFANLKRFYLKPTGRIAMEGNRFPIYDIGVRNLLVKMAEKGERDLLHDECVVTVTRNLEMEGRRCILLEAKHPVKRPHFDYHIARVYFDEEGEFPIAYEGYMWPEKEGDPPVLLEKYYYTDIKINIGTKDIDFDPANADYGYPRF